MKYSEMKSETKESVRALLADKCSYFLRECGLVIESTDEEIVLRQRNRVNQGVFEDVVDVTRVFNMNFIVDVERMDMVIRIY